MDEQSSTGKTLLEIYKQLGIEVFDQTGQIRSFYDVATDLSKVWGDLSVNEKDYIALNQAGANQTQNFLALMENFDTATEATATAMNSAGSATEENEAYMESLEAQTQNLKAAFQELANDVIDKELVSGALKGLSSILQGLDTDIGQFATKLGLLTATGWGIESLLHVAKVIPAIGGQLKTFGIFVGKLVGAIPALLSGTTTLSAAVGTATAGVAGFSSVALPAIAVITAIGIGVYELAKAYKDAHPSLETINSDIETNTSQLDTNKQRLSEINDIPWYDRTPEIIKEKDSLQKENEELQNQINKLDELKKAKLAEEFENRNLTVGTGEKYYTVPGLQLGVVEQYESAEEAVRAYLETMQAMPVTQDMVDEALENNVYNIKEWEKEVTYSGDELDSYIANELTAFKNEIAGQTELTDEQILRWNELSAEANKVNDSYIAATGSAAPFNDTLEEINYQLAVSEKETKELNNVFVITEEEAEALTQKNKSLAAAIERTDGVLTINTEKLFGVEGQTIETKKAIADLIAQEVIFNNKNLNVKGKISQLYSLAKAAGATAKSLTMVSSLSGILSEVDNPKEGTFAKPGTTGTERVEHIKNLNKNYGSGKYDLTPIDFDSVVEQMFDDIEYTIDEDSGTIITSGGNETGGKTKGSKPKDLAMEAFQGKYKDLKHMREMDLTTEADYYNQLEGLVNEYVNNASQHMQEYGLTQEEIQRNVYQYTEEIYKGRQKLEEEGSEKATDKALKNFEKQNKLLKHNLAMGLISEKDYYDQLEKLVNDYKTDATAHMEEYGLNTDLINEKMFQYEEEIYKGRETLRNNLTDVALENFDKEYRALKHQLALKKISQQEYYKSLETLMNKYREDATANMEAYGLTPEEIQENMNQYEEELFQGNEDITNKLAQDAVDRFRDQYDELGKLREFDKIEEEQYYSSLVQLVNNYVKDATEHMEEYGLSQKEIEDNVYQYIEEIYKGRKKLAEEAAHEAEEAAKKAQQEKDESISQAIQAEKDKLEEIKSAYEEYANFMVENINDKIKEYKDKRAEISEEYDEEIKKLNDINKETERGIKLAELQEKLAKAKQTQILVYKDGRFQYTQDIAAVSAAKADLDAYNREESLRKQTEAIEKAKNDALENIDAIIEKWEDYKKNWSNLAEDYERTQNRLLIEQQLGIDIEQDNWKERLDNARDFVNEYNGILEQIKQNEEIQQQHQNDMDNWEDENNNKWEDDFQDHWGDDLDEDIRDDFNGVSPGEDGTYSSGTATLPNGVTIPVSFKDGRTQNVGLPLGTIVHTDGGDFRITGGTGRPGDLYTSEKLTDWSALWWEAENNPNLTPAEKKRLQDYYHSMKVKEMSGSGQTFHPGSGTWYKDGTLSASGGLSLVGEQGAEMRVLNKGDGIIPADITRNLWTWGTTSPADMIAHLTGGSNDIVGKTMSVIIENLNLPEVKDGNDFVNFMKNNFWTRTMQFSAR